mmetsp:Transcript_27166/g.79145  ORF Transcript_27166/g.79145 Transcript_27166/m.79145 type:complete len:259 (+) Transcript_27166:4466-5242(+)
MYPSVRHGSCWAGSVGTVLRECAGASRLGSGAPRLLGLSGPSHRCRTSQRLGAAPRRPSPSEPRSPTSPANWPPRTGRWPRSGSRQQRGTGRTGTPPSRSRNNSMPGSSTLPASTSDAAPSGNGLVTRTRLWCAPASGSGSGSLHWTRLEKAQQQRPPSCSSGPRTCPCLARTRPESTLRMTRHLEASSPSVPWRRSPTPTAGCSGTWKRLLRRSGTWKSSAKPPLRRRKRPDSGAWSWSVPRGLRRRAAVAMTSCVN